MISAEQKADIWGKIKKIKVAMMTSQDGSLLRSRPMYLVQKDFEDGKLWFFNDEHSHKTVEVESHSEVNLSFADIDEDCYVSLSGSARVVDDQTKINQLWNPMLDVWFPQGKDAPEVGLLEIDITQAEYWDTTAGKMRQVYEMTKAKFGDHRPDIGEHRRFS